MVRGGGAVVEQGWRWWELGSDELEVGIGRPGLGVIGRSGEGGGGLGLGREGLERVGHRAGRRPWRALAAALAFRRARQCAWAGKASMSTHGSRGIDFHT